MKCILVVDDSATNLKCVESTLKDLYKLILVKSGRQALRYLENNSADMVLLDVLMPEMDGFQLLERMQELEKCKEVPVIFLTGGLDAGSVKKGLEMGAVDFIEKPIEPEVLRKRIGEILHSV